MILEALIQGGWADKKEEEEADKLGAENNENEAAEHSLVSSILKGADDNEMVQSALSNQNVSTEIIIIQNIRATRHSNVFD